MVSLRRIAHDPAFLEPCECIVPPHTDSIALSSEEDDGEHDVWVRNEVYCLTRENPREIASHTGWLSDEVIAAAQMLILQHFPTMRGWPLYISVLLPQFTVGSSFRLSTSGVTTGVLSPALAVRLGS